MPSLVLFSNAEDNSELQHLYQLIFISIAIGYNKNKNYVGNLLGSCTLQVAYLKIT